MHFKNQHRPSANKHESKIQAPTIAKVRGTERRANLKFMPPQSRTEIIIAKHILRFVELTSVLRNSKLCDMFKNHVKFSIFFMDIRVCIESVCGIANSLGASGAESTKRIRKIQERVTPQPTQLGSNSVFGRHVAWRPDCGCSERVL